MSTEQDKVNKLKRRVQGNMAARKQQEDADNARYATDRLIDGEPKFAKDMHFYCSKHGDFVATGVKETASDWNRPGQRIAWYRAIGEAAFVFTDGRIKSGKACSHSIRRITDKMYDPFFTESKMLQKMRVDMADDLLQPNDPRFYLKYGDVYAKFNAQRELEERQAWQNSKNDKY